MGCSCISDLAEGKLEHIFGKNNKSKFNIIDIEEEVEFISNYNQKKEKNERKNEIIQEERNDLKKDINTHRINEERNEPKKNLNTNKINEERNNRQKNLDTNKSNNKSNEEKNKADDLIFNKELCKDIANSLPKRTGTTLQGLKDLMKSKCSKLSNKEKSYIVFLWICENIAYDADSYYTNNITHDNCTPEVVFKRGLGVCSGYSRLYKDIATYIGLEIECVNCYAKGASYETGKIMKESNHEYNVVKLNNKWYPIDSTWGAGNVDGVKFIKCYKEFYFLANPEILINTHFPVDDKWQLTKKKYTLDEFLKWPKVKSDFYQLGFEKFIPNEAVINLKDSNKYKFIIYGNDMNKKAALCSIYLLKGNSYDEQLNLSSIYFYDNRFEVETIFNQKGKYKVEIFATNDKEKKYNFILEYIVMVENDAKQKLAFPTTYKGSEEINIIEPLYDNLKSGNKVKFKIKSNLEDIIIIDDEWHYLKKNKTGYFEFETIIKSKKGNNVQIVKKNASDDYNTLVSFNVV